MLDADRVIATLDEHRVTERMIAAIERTAFGDPPRFTGARRILAAALQNGWRPPEDTHS